MAKNENKSMLDTGQLWKRVFQTDHDALRVIHANNIETEISLSHDEGDSIVSKCLSHTIPANTQVDCSFVKRVMAYKEGTITLYADGAEMTMPILAAQVMEICAMQLKCDVILVGQ